MTDALDLTGIRADTAHGFLAGLGVLQALRGHPGARLSWTRRFRPHARVHGIDEQQLLEAILADRDRRLRGAVLDHPAGTPFDTLKCSVAELTGWATRIGDLPDDDPDIDLWSGLLVEGGFDNNGKSKPTHFDFSAGQVKFLRAVRELGATIDEDRLREALFGPWRYDRPASGLRFEASGERIGALRAIPPAKDPAPGVPGADWLAFRGLAYYPLTLASGRDRPRVVTAACATDWNRGAFRWVVWRPPLDHPTVAALVTDPRLVGERVERLDHRPAALAALDVSSVWQCAIVRSGQGYGSFGPPKRIAAAT